MSKCGPSCHQPCPVHGPNLIDQAVGFGKAVVDHVMAGMPEVDDETYYARLGECEKCPLRAAGWKCKGCGCELLVKARWAEQRCPLCVRCERLRDQHSPGDGCEGFLAKWERERPGAVKTPGRSCCG